MKQAFLDTNILARFLVGDVESQQVEVRKIFAKGIDLEYEYILLLEVLIELNYVLTSHYELSKQDFIEAYNMLINLPFITLVTNFDSSSCIKFYSKLNISLEDSIYLDYCLKNKLELITFDKKLHNAWKKLSSER
ncbi:MAG: PIN domain-containing protein [Patescibacteria group bacterium]